MYHATHLSAQLGGFKAIVPSGVTDPAFHAATNLLVHFSLQEGSHITKIIVYGRAVVDIFNVVSLVQLATGPYVLLGSTEARVFPFLIQNAFCAAKNQKTHFIFQVERLLM